MHYLPKNRLYTKMLRKHLFSIFTIRSLRPLNRDDTVKCTLNYYTACQQYSCQNVWVGTLSIYKMYEWAHWVYTKCMSGHTEYIQHVWVGTLSIYQMYEWAHWVYTKCMSGHTEYIHNVWVGTLSIYKMYEWAHWVYTKCMSGCIVLLLF